ncbi:hypothetical protein A8M31_06230 [Escherichia coli]|nr:hypothetical protein A8M31_06230 [Escherichia coli]
MISSIRSIKNNNPATVPGFLLPSPHHTPFKKPPRPHFSYRYAMQVTKLILLAIKHLISKHIN